MIPYVNRLDMLQLSGMWTERRPHLTDWWARVKARPWFEREMLGYAPAPLRAAATAPSIPKMLTGSMPDIRTMWWFLA